MNSKNRPGGSSSNPIAETEASRGPDYQAAPAKAGGLRPIDEELESVSGGRPDDGRHKPPRA